MNKSFIDMSRPQMLYFSGLGILMITSLAVSNISSLAFSAYVEFAARKQLCAALFVFGAVLGAVAAQRHLERARRPWQVPQSQITIPFIGFFILTLLAIAVAH